MSTISVSLPSDGTTGTVSQYNTPITTVVNAINGGLDNTNIAVGAAIATSKIATDAGLTGASIATGGVTAANLATSAITLGYAQITALTTTASTTAVQVTGLTATVTIPAGGRRIRITAYASRVYSTSSAGENRIEIWDGTVGSGTILGSAQTSIPALSNPNTVIATAIVTPAAGTKTYNVSMRTSAGTLNLDAASTYPAFILVEAI